VLTGEIDIKLRGRGCPVGIRPEHHLAVSEPKGDIKPRKILDPTPELRREGSILILNM
jgi:hypothetical protein